MQIFYFKTSNKKNFCQKKHVSCEIFIFDVKRNYLLPAVFFDFSSLHQLKNTILILHPQLRPLYHSVNTKNSRNNYYYKKNL